MRLMLHDNFQGLSQNESLNVWPPVKWDEFKPNGQTDILNHYYAYSSGCKTPTLFGGLALAAAGVATAGFGAASLAGAKAALLAIKSKALVGTSKVIGAKSADLISKEVSKSAKLSAQKAGNTAKLQARRKLDNASERRRIVDTYQRQYQKMQSGGFQGRVANMDLEQLKGQIADAKRSVKISADKCKKVPCDQAGCRNMGVLNARVQYLEALEAAYKRSGTSTPGQYNEKFAKAIETGKTSLAGFGVQALVPLLIIGGLVFSRLKK